MAGIICRGNNKTAERLRRIAGIDAPVKYRHGTKRNSVGLGQPCRNCGRPLHPWTRVKEEIPNGFVMAYARGFCINCRPAYRAYWNSLPPEEREQRGLRKEIDRSRHFIVGQGRDVDKLRREKANAYWDKKRAELADAQNVPVGFIVSLTHAADMLEHTAGTIKSRAAEEGALIRTQRTVYTGQRRVFVNVLALGYKPPQAAKRHERGRAAAARRLDVEIQDVVSESEAAELLGVEDVREALKGRPYVLIAGCRWYER